MLYGLSGIFSFAFVCFSFCEIDLEPKGRSRHHEVFCRKRVLEISQNSQQNICPRVSFLKKETLTQVFSLCILRTFK